MLATIWNPCPVSFSASSVSASAAVNSLCTRVRTTGGVPAGATMPTHEAASKPGSVSATVGASGRCAMRFRLPMASGLIRLAPGGAGRSWSSQSLRGSVTGSLRSAEMSAATYTSMTIRASAGFTITGLPRATQSMK